MYGETPDNEVRIIGENLSEGGGDNPEVVHVETQEMDKLTGQTKKEVVEALDTVRLASILNLWEMMHDLKELYDSRDSVYRVGEGPLERKKREKEDGLRQKRCNEKIMQLENDLLAYKQFLTKDKVYRLYQNGSKNFVANNLDELKWLLSPELGYDMIKDGYSRLVMSNLNEFGISFNRFFVDKLIELNKCDVIADYIEYAEPSQQKEFVVKIIKEWYSDKIWYKLWKVKGLKIEEAINLMLEEDVEPSKIREWLTIYSAHIGEEK